MPDNQDSTTTEGGQQQKERWVAEFKDGRVVGWLVLDEETGQIVSSITYANPPWRR